MEAKLIKIDRNGSKHFEGMVTCDRCGGVGYYAVAVCNGAPVLSPYDGGVCWKCLGTGKVKDKWIERTPEYQAKLDARRKAKMEAQKAEYERIKKEKEAEEEARRKEREAKIKAQKAISQHVGEVGHRITATATLVKCAFYEFKSFSGYGTDTMHVYIFKDADENVMIWKTTAYIDPEEGDKVEIKGTVKEHAVYKDEKQTILTRCKVKVIEEA